MPNSILFTFAVNIIDVALIFYFVLVAFKVKVNRLFNISYVILLQASFNTIVNINLGHGSFVGFIVMYLTVGIIFYIYFNKNIFRLYLFIIIGLALSTIAELLSAGILVGIFKIEPIILVESNMYRALGVLLSKILFFLIVRYIVKKISINHFVQKKQLLLYFLLLLFNIIVLFSVITIFFRTNLLNNNTFIYLAGAIIGAIAFSSLIFYIIKKMLLQSQKEIMWEMREKEYKNQLVYMKNIEEMFEAMKAQKHDFNNYISTIYGLVYLNKTDEAREYLKVLSERISCNSKIIDVNHPIIAALINVKMDRADRENIDMDIDISIPKELPYDLIDLTVVLGNLLDNAIEACMKLDETDKYIFINMYIKDAYLIIKINNSKIRDIVICKEQIDERYTTKEDSDNHGYGLLNIKQIVNKYDGIIKVEDLENEFSVRIALPIDYRSEFELSSVK